LSSAPECQNRKTTTENVGEEFLMRKKHFPGDFGPPSSTAGRGMMAISFQIRLLLKLKMARPFNRGNRDSGF
jgi:hypothetical protein